MSRGDELAVARLIGRLTDLEFSGKQFPLEDWGKPDCGGNLIMSEFFRENG
jgi:hypothetical protein